MYVVGLVCSMPLAPLPRAEAQNRRKKTRVIKVRCFSSTNASPENISPHCAALFIQKMMTIYTCQKAYEFSTSSDGVAVSTFAFQPGDPGSIPGTNYFC